VSVVGGSLGRLVVRVEKVCWEVELGEVGKVDGDVVVVSVSVSVVHRHYDYDPNLLLSLLAYPPHSHRRHPYPKAPPKAPAWHPPYSASPQACWIEKPISTS
jgi:hypothetical protein